METKKITSINLLLVFLIVVVAIQSCGLIVMMSKVKSLEKTIFAQKSQIIPTPQPLPTLAIGAIDNSYVQDLLIKKTFVLQKASPEQLKNVKVALDYINNRVIGDGRIFSFNDNVGYRSVERGFVKALGSDDKSIRVGGGTSIASTIIYQAAEDAGLDILESHPFICNQTKDWYGAGVDLIDHDLQFRDSYKPYLGYKPGLGYEMVYLYILCGLSNNVATVAIYRVESIQG